MKHISYTDACRQVTLDKFSCLPHKDLFICPLKWQGQPSIFPLHQHLLCYFNPFSEKEKPQSFSRQVWVFLLPLLLLSFPPSHTLFSGDNPVIIPSSPCLQTPLPHPTLLCCPASFPITPPLSFSYHELYYFDPSPSICFNWIMICNHVLSGESIKRDGASAPLLRGLLLFPHTPHTHLIQALLLSAFKPSLNTLAHGQPLQPAVALVKGVEEGGGLMAPLLIFHGPHFPMEGG